MSEPLTTDGFGLIVIGSEILDGRYEDSHFAAAGKLLRERDVSLAYFLLLPDDPGLLERQFGWAMEQPVPFFCCGGIGSTPDDYTRACAAAAAGLPLVPHPEGTALLRKLFKDRETPERLRMAEFPEGAGLIPNPVNKVSGFHIRNGYFLPGFPSMAEPMMEWVLDTLYTRGTHRIHSRLILPCSREADVVPLMEEFIREHPDISFSSLPHFTARGTEVELGLSGAPRSVVLGMTDLKALLARNGVRYE